MQLTCEHCGNPYQKRVGRGLCRVCWNDKAIREQYPIKAAFGGVEAAALRLPRRKTMSELLKKGEML